MKSAVSVAMEGKYSPKMFELPDLLDSEAIVDRKVGITVDRPHCIQRICYTHHRTWNLGARPQEILRFYML